MPHESDSQSPGGKKGERMWPIGKGSYLVKPGDSLESIAFDHGFFHETLLTLEENAEVREHRLDHNALLPGDRITIPEKRQKAIASDTGRQHTFRRKGVPALLRMRLQRDGIPYASMNYTLEIDGVTRTGVTSSDGILEQRVSPGARTGALVIWPDRERFTLRFGMLDPLTEITGIQNRLTNLGYDCRPFDGTLNRATIAAIRTFQRRNDLPVTGAIDDALRQALDNPFAT